MFVLTSPEDHQPLTLGSLLQPQIARASTLFKQFWVTGCSCQCHHLLEWDHVSSAHPVSGDLTWERRGSAGETETERFKRAETADCMRGRWPGRCDELVQILSLNKSKKTVMVIWNQSGLQAFLIPPFLQSWEHKLQISHQKIKKKRFISFSPSPNIAWSDFHAQLQFMPKEGATINVYDWLKILSVVCFMAHWLWCLFKGCKDKALSCHFN